MVTVMNKKRLDRLIAATAIAAGGTALVNVSMFDQAGGAITVRQIYGVAITAGIRVFILASPDNSFNQLDTENPIDAFVSFDPSYLAATSTIQTTKNLDIVPPFFQILVRNLDAVNPQGACTVWLTKRGI